MNKRKVFWLSFLMGGLFSRIALSEDLKEALGKAYANSIEIEQAASNLKVAEEAITQASAGWRPVVQGSVSYGKSWKDTKSGIPGTVTGRTNTQPGSASVSLSQNLYQGGRTQAAIKGAEEQVSAAQAALKESEQKALLEAIAAYLNLFTATEKVALEQSNQKLLERYLEVARIKFEYGDGTNTDVATAESRYAKAQADYIKAKADLDASLSNYLRIVGELPTGKLKEVKDLPLLPKSVDEMIEQALISNPELIAADHTENYYLNKIEETRSLHLPSLDFQASVNRNKEFVAPRYYTDDVTVGATLTIPIYQGGAVSSKVRESYEQATLGKLSKEDKKRKLKDTIKQSFEAFQAAQARLEQFKAQIKAAEVALAGVTEEQAVGARTLLEVLITQQDLLAAQVSLVEAERDVRLTAFQMLSYMGRLTLQSFVSPILEENDSALSKQA